ncbi:MAG: hypothetical protein ACU0C9_05920 [Paracoccaceae bacterium]
MAIASGKIACVFLIDGELKDWQCSRAAAKSVTKARSFVRMITATFEPDLVILEDPHGPTRKGGTPRDVLYALAQDADDAGLPSVLVARAQMFANKYEEAQALAKKYPFLKGWIPKEPKIWEGEPIDTIYFEALSMVEQVRLNKRG